MRQPHLNAGELVFDKNLLSHDVYDLSKNMESVIRWEHWVHSGAEVENDCQHTFSQAVVTILLSEVLIKEGKIGTSDAYLALACGVLHDVGETITGDQLYGNKTSADEMKERGVVNDLFSKAFGVESNSMLRIFDVQDGAKKDTDVDNLQTSTLIFGLAEKLCYYMYAVRQYERAGGIGYGREILSDVVTRQRKGVLQQAEAVGLAFDRIPIVFEADELLATSLKNTG